MSDYLTDPQIYMHLSVSIKKADGNALDRAHKVSVVNNLLNSMFRTVEITLGNTQLPCSQNANPYVQYLYSLLSYGKAAQDTILQPSLWHRDQKDIFDVTSITSVGTTDGHKDRAAWIYSGVVDLCGPLQLDLCKMSRLLVPMLNINFKFFRSNPQFVMLAWDEDSVSYQIAIEQAEIWVRRVKPRLQDLKWIETELSRHPAVYPLIMHQMVTYSMPAGMSNLGELCNHRPMQIFRYMSLYFQR